MLASVWNAKENNLFRAGMNKWFRRKYFVEKCPNALSYQSERLRNRYEKILVLSSEVHIERQPRSESEVITLGTRLSERLIRGADIKVA